MHWVKGKQDKNKSMVRWSVFGLCAVLLAGAYCVAMGGNVDVLVLARTLWGEARGEGREGMEAVASVIINRVNWPHTVPLWWGSTVEEVCKKKTQFEVWNEGNPNRAKMEDVTEDSDEEFRMALEIAKQAVAGGLTDRTRGATHFYAPGKINPPPSWTMCKGVQPKTIGNHTFYRIGPGSCPDEL